ncbi:MAG: ABC transporter substrate-binding protein [Spirulinaceae cyanobacterium]
MFKFLRAIAIALLTFGIVVSCMKSPPIESHSQGDCRAIQHALGETCVPLQPQRLVVLGGTTLESCLAIGVQPLASQTDVLPHLDGKLEGIEILGWPLNLEQVVSLQPDLIIGLANGQEQDTYKLLSQIAPTLLANDETSGDWKAVVQFVGEILGKPDAAAQVLADYQARLDTLQQQIGDNIEAIEVSVVRLYPDKINLYLQDSFIGTILADAGLGRPLSQQLNRDRALMTIGNPIQMSISKERLVDADGDVIFLVTYHPQPQLKQELQTKLRQLQADPLWSKLEAVQQNQVYTVGSHWIVSGPLAADAVIDDLFNYLLEN